MAQVIASNHGVQKALQFVQADVNAVSSIRLFRTNLAITPATLFSDFVEATFTSYVRQSGAGQFNAVQKLATGLYVFQSNLFSFPCADVVGQNVYGWYLADGTDWEYAASFPVPVLAKNPNPVQFTIALLLQSLSIPCPWG